MTAKRIALYLVGAVLLLVGGAAVWKLGPALLPAKRLNVGIAVGSKVPVTMALQDNTDRKSVV